MSRFLCLKQSVPAHFLPPSFLPPLASLCLPSVALSRYNNVARTHTHTQLHTLAWYNNCTNSHLPSFCLAGVALMALGGALGICLVALDAAALCVAGAAQTHIDHRLAWQAWHELTSTIVLCGRRGSNGTGWRAWFWFSRP